MATTPPSQPPSGAGPGTTPNRPQNTTSKATDTITSATTKLSDVVARLERTLRVLNSQFDKLVDDVSDVDSSVKTHSKAVERLTKSALNGAKSLADLHAIAASTAKDLRDVGTGSQQLTKTLVSNTSHISDALGKYGDSVAERTKKYAEDMAKQAATRKDERTALLRTKKTLADLMDELTKSKTIVTQQATLQQRASQTLHQRQKALLDLNTALSAQSQAAQQAATNSQSTQASNQTAQQAQAAQSVSAKSAAKTAEGYATALDGVYNATASIDIIGKTADQAVNNINLVSAAIKQKLAGELDSNSALEIRDLILSNAMGVAEELDSLVAALNNSTAGWEQAALKDADRRRLADEMQVKSDVMLWGHQREMEQQAALAADQMASTAVELKRLREEYAAAKLIADPSDSASTMAAVAASIAATTSSAQQAQASLTAANTQHAASVTALSGRANFLGKAFNYVANIAQGLATGKYLKDAVVGMFKELQYQASHGVANSGSEFLGNYFDSMLSGVNAKVYQETMASTKMSQLSSASHEEFRRAMTSSTSKLFEYTGDRDEAFKISGEIYQAMSRVGVSAGTAKTGIDKLVPVMGQLSKITGKSTQELAKFAAALYEDNDFRLTSLGLNDKEQANRAAAIMQSEREMVLQGYTLEQARAINKENAAARLRSTVQSRTKDVAVLLQQLGIASFAAGGEKTEAGRKLKADQTRLTEIQRSLQTSKDSQGNQLSHEDLDKLRLERSTIGSRLQKEATTGALEYQDSNPQLAGVYESMVKSLDSISSFGGTKQADIATGKIDEKRGNEESKKGESGAFSGMFGSLTSAIQWMMSIGTSNPVVFIASLVAANKLSGAAGMFGGIGGMLGKVGGMGGTIGKVGGWLGGLLGGAGGAAGGMGGTIGKVGGWLGGLLGGAGGAAGGAAASGGLLKTVLKVGKGASIAGGISLVGDYASEKLNDSGHEKLGAATGILSDAATGAAIGSMVPIIGTTIGALAGAAYGTYQNWDGLVGSSQPNTKPSEIVSKQQPQTSLASTVASTPVNTPVDAPIATIDQVVELLTKMYKIQQELAPDEAQLNKLQLELLGQPDVTSKMDRLDNTFSSLFKAKG